MVRQIGQNVVRGYCYVGLTFVFPFVLMDRPPNGLFIVPAFAKEDPIWWIEMRHPNQKKEKNDVRKEIYDDRGLYRMSV